MQVIIDNIEQFKVFFDVVYDMASELIELKLLPDRMTCAMLDRSKTRFFHVEYESRFFDTYDVDGEESVTIFVEDMHKLLKSCNKKDTLFMEVNDPYLLVKIVSDNGNSRIFEFVLPSDFVDSPVPPHSEFLAVFDVDVNDLKQSVKDIGLIGSDLIKFVVNGDTLNITTDNDIATSYVCSVGIDDASVDENVSSQFGLNYIGQILKFDKISKSFTMKMKQDFPLFFTFKDELMGVSVTGMIAPILPEEEE